MLMHINGIPLKGISADTTIKQLQKHVDIKKKVRLEAAHRAVIQLLEYPPAIGNTFTEHDFKVCHIVDEVWEKRGTPDYPFYEKEAAA